MQSFRPQPDAVLLSPLGWCFRFLLSRLHAVETKAFRIIGISRDEAESLGLSLSLTAGRSLVFLSSTISSPASLPLLCLSPHPESYADLSNFFFSNRFVRCMEAMSPPTNLNIRGDVGLTGEHPLLDLTGGT